MANDPTSYGKDFSLFVSKSVATGLEKALRELAPKLAENVRKTFDDKGARGGHEPWVIRSNPTPLIQSGALKNSIEGSFVKSGDEYVAVIGTDVEYAKKHNEGLDGMPKREFLFLTNDDQELIDSVMAKYVGVSSS